MKSCYLSQFIGKLVYYCLAALLLWFIAPKSHASEWTYSFPGKLSLQHNDNLNQAVTDKTAAYRLRLIPGLSLQRETKQSRFGLDFTLTIDRYYEIEEDYDRNDPHLTAIFEHEFSNSMIGARAKLIRRPTFEAQFEDTARANDTGSKNTVEVGGFGLFDLDERNSIGIDGLIQDVTFNSEKLTDYQYETIKLELNSQRTTHLSIQGFITSARFTNENSSPLFSPDSNSLLFGMGSKYALFEFIQLGAWIGA